MAFWVVGGDSPLPSIDDAGRRSFIDGGKRRVDYPEEGNDSGFEGFPKRARMEGRSDFVDRHREHQDWHHDHGHPREQHFPDNGYVDPGPMSVDNSSIQVKNLAFLVIRQRSPTPDASSSPEQPPAHTNRRPCSMERTESGLSISSDVSHHSPHDEDSEFLMGDLDAARLVRKHAATFRRRWPDSQHSRILKALINPKSRDAEFPLDNDALRSIFSAANELFFANRLARRVAWDWSHAASAQYQSHIVGTTALRRSARLGGYETLIVLSSPILKDTKYNRRLLISTFLHEMIHSFLFVTCGLKARECGGHTEGFRQIAEVIDEWVGKEHLRLRDMDADLERFRDDDQVLPAENSHFEAHNSSNGLTAAHMTEWHPRQHHEYLTEPRPQRQRDHGEWEWQEREGFWVRNTQATASPFVY